MREDFDMPEEKQDAVKALTPKVSSGSLSELLTGAERGALKAEPLSILVFFACVLVSLIAWSVGSSEDRLRVPLLLGGLAAIVLTVVRRENAAVAFLAVLIVGVLVAPRDYLLRIAHMVARPTTSFEDYAKRYDGEAADPAAVTKLVTERVAEALKKQGVEVDASVRKAIGDVVTDTEAERIVARVRREGADFPLRQLQRGDTERRSLVRQYGDLPAFHEDMQFLRSERLIEFPGNAYSEATLTSLGEQIARRLDRSGTLFDPDTKINESRRKPPAESSMEKLAVGQSRSVELRGGAPAWVLFEVSKVAVYTIEAKAPDKTDTAITLYRAGEGKELAYDDDGGGGIDPRLEQTLQPGKYFVAVEEIFGLGSKSSRVQVSVKEAPRKGA